MSPMELAYLLEAVTRALGGLATAVTQLIAAMSAPTDADQAKAIAKAEDSIRMSEWEIKKLVVDRAKFGGSP